MIKKTCLAALFVLIAVLSRSQDFSKTFGKISNGEIELDQYALDKDAEAVVLFDMGKSYFDETENSFDVIFERTTRIKILSEAGIKWSEVKIPFYQEGDVYENVFDIEINVYNLEDGHINKLSFNNPDSYIEKENNYWNFKKFAVPNVKKGTVLEYKYKISSQYKFNLRDWEFQWKIPVVYSEYEVKMIPFYEYTWLLQGANKFDYQNSYIDKAFPRRFGSVTFRDMVHKYVMKNVPAFNNEEFITSINDYIIKLDFQLSKVIYPDGGSTTIIDTWENMIKAFLKHVDFGKYVSRSKKLAAKIIDIEKIGKKTDKEKFNHVLNYVKSNYNWNGENGRYASKTPKKFTQEKYGNCADVNLFTIGLLEAVGVKAVPVLISTRDHGKIKYDYPYTHFFNYVLILAEVDGKKILTDATEVLNLNNRIPPRCINDKGLIIKKNNVAWVSLERRFPSEIATDIHIEVDTSEKMNVTVSKTANEYDALYYRNQFSGDINKIKPEIETTGYTVIDSSITIKNQLDKENPYILTYKQTGSPERVNGKIYVSPFLDLSISDNPLKQKKRTYPVDMIYPKKRTFSSTIIIPEGYKVDYLPVEQKIDNGLFGMTYKAVSDSGRVAVSFSYFFKKTVYEPKVYSMIKYYFKEIVKNSNEKVVLTKIADK